ncbi:branched-chain amino acid transport system substrate-binding protein [Thermocatellispora tengchongensis]|uniref:Branched-chain amino acid transport system substrate-binding protein n=1 Tax=Thermocatellispora tengchongensis TaxID=1073253 RepID=A0A840P8Z9_9ACTN|nr:ABC transporter substrate-binding protein [Thermocatellispora tengchongensis]MBB5137854.1 branched-chain amino acid transport system substrate-binding protein [Thermocatellispora tengchongensis]
MNRTAILTALLPALLLTAACGAGAGQDADAPVVLGASLSLTGPLGTIGRPQQAGLERLVADVNARGGVQVGGVRRELALRVLDNRSEAAAAGQQASELILKDSAAALVGGCTPPINTPIAQIAEKNRVPLVTSCFPLGAFRDAAPAGGWTYAWDFHFEETEQARVLVEAAGLAGAAKKAALFTDNEVDGVIQRKLFRDAAVKAGYEIVGDYTFPVGQSDFSSFVNDAKRAGAEVVLGQMIPPDGIALVKQMKSLSYTPKVIGIAKAADTASWLDGLGELADNTVHNGFWVPDRARPATAAFLKAMEGRFADTASLGIAAAAYSVGEVVADALARAGSTDPEKLNEAIGATKGAFVFAEVAFGPDHTSPTPVTAEQWQDGVTRQVFPAVEGVTLRTPPLGLE